MSSVQQVRHEKMLKAGQVVILRSGFRAATMEAIAAEAGVAKATLYKYFPDKNAIYETLVVRLAEELRLVFDKALAGSGTPAERIAAGLTAKKKFVFRLLHSSPHARELSGGDMDMHLNAGWDIERHIEDEVRRVLTPELGDDANYMTQLLIACASGIGDQAKYAEQIGPAIRLVVHKLLA